MYKSQVFIQWVQKNYTTPISEESTRIAQTLQEIYNYLEQNGFCPVHIIKLLRHDLAKSNPRLEEIMLGTVKAIDLDFCWGIQNILSNQLERSVEVLTIF